MLTRPSSDCPSLPHTGIQDVVGWVCRREAGGREDGWYSCPRIFLPGGATSKNYTKAQHPALFSAHSGTAVMSLNICSCVLVHTWSGFRTAHLTTAYKSTPVLASCNCSPPSGTSPTSTDFWGTLYLLYTLPSALCLPFIFICTSGVDGSLHAQPTKRQETRGLAHLSCYLRW